MTKDYYSVLRRATSALAPSTEEARQAVYDRARLAIMDADLPSEQTRSERAALEAAIERIEADADQAGRARLQQEAAARRPPVVAAAHDEHGPTMPALSRPVLVGAGAAAIALLIVGIAGAVYWGGRTDRPAPAPATKAPAVVADRATAGSNQELSYVFKRQLVYYRSIHPVGTIVIAKSQRFLYLVRPDVVAMRYTIGVGRECANAAGLLVISAKEGGLKEPRLAAASGAGADPAAPWLNLGDTGHRIFGTNPPLVSGGDGCFRLVNEDAIDLYDRVSVGTRVVIN